MRLTIALGSVLSIVALLAATPSNAQIVVDQSQLVINGNGATFSQTDLAQSFQPGLPNIVGARLFLSPALGAGGGTITIALYDALPNAGGNLLATGSAPVSMPGDTAEVLFPSAIPVTVDTTYFLVFTSTNDTLAIGGTTFNSYPRGQMFASTGFVPFPDFDFTFQTLSTLGAGQAAPEPGTLALAGLGIAGLVLGYRKRRPYSFRPALAPNAPLNLPPLQTLL
jgi:hypothetical protein